MKLISSFINQRPLVYILVVIFIVVIFTFLILKTHKSSLNYSPTAHRSILILLSDKVDFSQNIEERKVNKETFPQKTKPLKRIEVFLQNKNKSIKDSKFKVNSDDLGMFF